MVIDIIKPGSVGANFANLFSPFPAVLRVCFLSCYYCCLCSLFEFKHENLIPTLVVQNILSNRGQNCLVQESIEEEHCRAKTEMAIIKEEEFQNRHGEAQETFHKI